MPDRNPAHGLYGDIALKRRSILGMTGALVALVALNGSVLAAGPFTNGGFESGSAGTFDFGSAGVPSWTIVSGDVDVSGANVWPAQEGVQSLDLNGFGPGAIAQTIPTVVNATYFVQFYMAGNPGTHDQFPGGAKSPDVKTLDVTANGGPIDHYSFDTTAFQTSTFPFPAIGWTASRGFTFKATSTSTTIKFASTTPGAFGPTLDNITYTETLATGANCKDGGWQTMVNASGIPFKNQGACVSFYATSGATPIGK